MKTHLLPFLFATLWACGLTACSEDDGNEDMVGEGDLIVTVYGEDFIEEGIPAQEMGDAWAVTFDRFEVTVEQVVVGGVTVSTTDTLDLSVATNGAGHTLANALISAGDHKDASFSITRVEMVGSGTKDGITKTFDWTFDEATLYTACETTTTVTEAGEATFQITVHADHFFYDSLVAEEPQVLFQALADADQDNDGELTQAELEVTDIGGYDPGSAGDVNDLWTWLIAQSRTLGHVDGEGHCDAQPK